MEVGLPEGYVPSDRLQCVALQPFFAGRNFMKRRVFAYVDGFNLYHAINELGDPSLKWLDLWSLCEGICRQQRGEILERVYYFSAYATWLPGPYARHRAYVSALQHSGVDVVLGQFKRRDRRCTRCQHTWYQHEEKETDVNIGVHLVRDAVRGAFDRAILISADTDLNPAIRLARAEVSNAEIFIVAPPGRMSRARILNPSLELTRGRLRKALFPEFIYDKNGRIISTRPDEYDP